MRPLTPRRVTPKCKHGRDYWYSVLFSDMQGGVRFSIKVEFYGYCGRGGVVGLGVADGVYMWKMQGIDAGLFSRTLMATARREVERGSADALAGAGRWSQRLQHL